MNGVNSVRIFTQALQTDSTKTIQQSTPAPSAQTADKDEKATTVSLSSEAKTKFAEEKAQQTLEEEQAAKASESGSGGSPVDAVIKQIREQIQELKERIAILEAKGDEASLEQAKALKEQLVVLSSQLLDLLTEKSKTEKEIDLSL